MSKKLYRVKKDTFLWDEGAIIVGTKRDSCTTGYEAVSEIWNKIDDQDEYISEKIIINNPDYFERVYEVNALSKVLYKTREEAKEYMKKLHK